MPGGFFVSATGLSVMATKYLARTIIEGGRNNKDDRDRSHGEERARMRDFIAKASAYPDGFDALCIEPRDKVYKEFADKLGAPRRWLRAQVGRPWNKVRSEIFARFDPRNLAGQHIIFDHLLREVRVHETYEHWTGRYDLYVDHHGILRVPKPQKRALPRWCLERISCDDLAWLAGRRVGGEGTSLFWLIPHSYNMQTYYRQTQRLTGDELARWLSIPEKAREKHRRPREKSS
jgi:hypothetical protein